MQMTKTIIPYKQLMTPAWIDQNAEKTGPYDVMADYYEIMNTIGSKYQRALRVELVPPATLISTSSCTVTITVALDPTLPINQDHDPIFGISDKKSFIGFQTLDVQNFLTFTSCFRYEGDVDTETLKNRKQGLGPTLNSTDYFSEVKMRFRPADKWGCCQTDQVTEIDTGLVHGFLNIGNYESSLDPTSGLYLEVYRHSAREEYRIRYMEVEVEMDQ